MPSSPLQQLAIYADNVVLFIRPVEADLAFVRDTLGLFGEASGLRVNYAKSEAIMIRSEMDDGDLVAAALPWRMGNFPCTYLGLQLSIRHLTRSEWQPVIDSVLKLLPGWQRGLITRAGRMTLVNCVVRARPIHHLIVAEVPKWAVDRVDKGCRAFFWSGTEAIHGGKCMVAWQRICRPKEFGGLGTLDLRIQGITLRLRWEWLKRTDDSRPWQGLSLTSDRKVQDAFDGLVHWEVGASDRALFWRDRWIHGARVAEIAPLVWAQVSTQVINRRLVSRGLTDHDWTLDIRGELSTDAMMQFIQLWEILIPFTLNPRVPDKAVWHWSASGCY